MFALEMIVRESYVHVSKESECKAQLVYGGDRLASLYCNCSFQFLCCLLGHLISMSLLKSRVLTKTCGFISHARYVHPRRLSIEMPSAKATARAQLQIHHSEGQGRWATASRGLKRFAENYKT